MKKYCLALDLKNDPQSIKEYIRWHENVWPEIEESIKTSGIIHMEIYHLDTRLFMIIHTTNEFSFEEKNINDRANPKVQEWEKIMSTYQQQLPGSKINEKWRLMEKIYELE